VTGTIGFGALTAILSLRLEFALYPKSEEEFNASFVPMSMVGGAFSALMQVGLGTVMLIRTLKLYQVVLFDLE
jgi:uncharacterized membrane protein